MLYLFKRRAFQVKVAVRQPAFLLALGGIVPLSELLGSEKLV